MFYKYKVRALQVHILHNQSFAQSTFYKSMFQKLVFYTVHVLQIHVLHSPCFTSLYFTKLCLKSWIGIQYNSPTNEKL